MIEYAISRDGKLIDAGHIDEIEPVSKMRPVSLLKPPSGKTWEYNAAYWRRAGMTVLVGPEAAAKKSKKR